jgi:hypothetical protein
MAEEVAEVAATEGRRREGHSQKENNIDG